MCARFCLCRALHLKSHSSARRSWAFLLSLTCIGVRTLPCPKPCRRILAPTGKVDAWGSKKILHFLFFFTCLLQFGLSWLAQYPHKFNYTVTITASNAAAQYRLARTMLAALKAIMVWMFTYIAWQTMQTALGNARGLGPAFLLIALALIFGTIGIYFVKAAHAR